MDDHPPLSCHVCGTPKKFVRYGSKVGKDGREAKWPIYETCPNINDHYNILAKQRAEKRAQNGIKAKNKEREKVAGLCLAPSTSAHFSAIMCDGVRNVKDLEATIKRFNSKRGEYPIGIVMHPFDIGRIFPKDPVPSCCGIDVVSCKYLPVNFKSASLVVSWGEVPSYDD